MNKLKTILCLLLSLMLLALPVLSSAEATETPAPEGEAAAETPEEEIEFPDELKVGHPTITKGDFFTEMFGNDTADIDVRAMIHGYNLINWDQNQGEYVFDPSVVDGDVIAGQDEFGNKIYKILLCDDLYYSDGTKITAWDYAFSMLLMMSPEVEQIGGKIYRAEHLLGYNEYIEGRKMAIAGQPVPENQKALTGIEVHNDREIWIYLDADFLPYFFELGLLLCEPYPIRQIAPGCKVYSGEGGYGVYIGNEDLSIAEPIFTADLLRKTILDPETGYNSHPSVVSGPYTLTSWDGVTCHFEINPYFKGAWYHNSLPGGYENGPVQYIPMLDVEGNQLLDAQGNGYYLVKPTIEKVSFTVADNDTMVDKLVSGELDLLNKVTYGPTVAAARTAVGEYGVQMDNYPRIGLAFLTFTYDWPTVHEKEVRQAIAWCMDRDLLTREYCGVLNPETNEYGQSNGIRVDGYFGIEQWEYLLLNRQVAWPVNFIDEETVRIRVEDGEEDPTKKFSNRYYTTDEELEKITAAWEALADEWEGALVEYTVDLEEAVKMLKKGGWTLNREGGEFREGVDDVRCKQIDGQLVALDLKMLMPKGNHMKDFMEEDGNFISNLAQVGIKLTIEEAPMEDLLKAYYRQTERTTDMIYLATNFHIVVDPSITYSTDDTANHEIWNNTYSDDEELYYDAVNMRKTEPGDVFEYVSKWVAFQKRYNEVLPTIPIYSNIYFDFFNKYLQNYEITSTVTWSQAIVKAYFGLPPVVEETEEPEEAADGSIDFGD